MSSTVTFRLDPNAARILRELVRRQKGSKSRVIKEALRAHWKMLTEEAAPASREVYAALKILPESPRGDEGRHVSRLLREKLIAKRRNSTL